MKKLLTLSLALLLSLSFAMADGAISNEGKTWTSETESGVFKATIMCIPSLTVSMTEGDLGNFFLAEDSYNITGSSMLISMKGPATTVDRNAEFPVRYTLTYYLNEVEIKTFWFDSNTPENPDGSNNGTSSEEAWGSTFPADDDDAVTLSGTWGWNGGNETPMSCTNALEYTYTPNAINLGEGATTGAKTFTLGVKLVVSI